jgi:hypothetical protein
MKFVGSSRRPARVVRCLFGPGSVPETYSSYSSEITPGLDGRLSSPVEVDEVRKKEGVHNVHTLGFGSGRTGGGLGRIADVFGEVAEIQGPEPGSSPTSGTAFPLDKGGFCFNVCTLTLFGSL